jgi:hypothetical protein
MNGLISRIDTYLAGQRLSLSNDLIPMRESVTLVDSSHATHSYTADQSILSNAKAKGFSQSLSQSPLY